LNILRQEVSNKMGDKQGVVFNKPDPFTSLQIHDSVAKFVNTLPPNTRGGLATVATNKGVNAVLFTKINDKVEIDAWIGKTWGEPIEAGVAAKIIW